MKPFRSDDKYWTGTRNFDHIQYESDLEDYIEILSRSVVDESLLCEVIYLLSVKQPNNCPNWIDGFGDCGEPECTFCRIQKCINDLEKII